MLHRIFNFWRVEQAQWNADVAKSLAKETQLDTKSLQTRIRVLEQQCERLTLSAMAMAEILRDRLGVTEYEIEAKVTEIDLRDGKRDGQFRPPSGPCPNCRRENAPTRRNCLYCGEELSASSILFQSSKTGSSAHDPM